MGGPGASESRAHSISDERSISNLLAEYAEFLDLGDFKRLGGLFDHGAVRFEGGDERFEGAEAVAAMYASVVQVHDGLPRTMHVMTNTWISMDGDSATARSYFTVVQAHNDMPLQVVSGGRYHDKFHRRDGDWEFSERLIIRDFAGDLRYHLRLDPYGEL